MSIYKITKYALVGVSLLLAASACESRQQHVDAQETSPPSEPDAAINDAERLKNFEQQASAYYNEHGGADAETYKQQLTNKSCEVSVLPATDEPYQGAAFYKRFRKGVLKMGKMYKCGHCPEDHISTASAFVISADGVCVTNYHVFKSYDPSRPNEYITFFAMDVEQNIYPVTEVLAASKHDDLAVFKIDTQGQQLSPLCMGQEQPVGEPIHLISHPEHRFYTYTQGHIDRKYIKPGTTKIRQSISAEFAKGSSGAPIMDDCGNVVGVVAGTQNIYYDQEGKIYQSTIKEIIPVSRLKELIK
jgi:S1-C subfamily serine protease